MQVMRGVEMQKLLRAVIKPFGLDILQNRLKDRVFVLVLELSPSLIQHIF
jgi:hypothetical protein